MLLDAPCRGTFSLDELAAELRAALAGAGSAGGKGDAGRRLVPEAVRFTARLCRCAARGGVERFRFPHADERAAALTAVLAWAPESPWTIDILPPADDGPPEREDR